MPLICYLHSSLVDLKLLLLQMSNHKLNYLKYGAPQDSVLGPLLYSLYTTPLFSVISNQPCIQSYFYADNTQIYLLFSLEFASLAFSTTESCIRDLLSWISKKLSVNSNDTEYLLFNPNNVNFPVNIINLGSNTISLSDSKKNLGVIFQTDMSMDKQISSIVKSCFLQLRDYCRIRPFISKTVTITLAKAFIQSRLDFCNRLFYGLPKYSIHRLKKYKIQLLKSLQILFIFLIQLQLSNLYIGFLYFIIIISKYIALHTVLFL